MRIVQSCVEHPVGSSSIRTLLTATVDELLYSFNWYTIYEDLEEFIYLGSKQSSNGYCRLDVLRRIGRACSVMNSLQRVWNCSNLSISTKVHLYQSLIRSVLL